MNRKWQRDCPYCGVRVGIVGNWLAVIFGNRIHSCDFNKYKQLHGLATRTPQADKEEKD